MKRDGTKPVKNNRRSNPLRHFGRHLYPASLASMGEEARKPPMSPRFSSHGCRQEPLLDSVIQLTDKPGLGSLWDGFLRRPW